MILVALSCHSLLEGLAIGVQNTHIEVYQLFLGITIHKFVIAFAIGLEIFCATRKLKTLIIYQLIFAIFSPVGLVIGSVTNQIVSPRVSGVLNAGFTSIEWFLLN
jgi:zinc transporter 1/2/3